MTGEEDEGYTKRKRADVLVVGGVGYLGYNIARYHREVGDSVAVVARHSSVARRQKLAEELASLEARIKIVDDLGRADEALRVLEELGCPHISYIVVGRLHGSFRELLRSNAELPALWTDIISRNCDSSLIVYTSNILAAGRPRKAGEPIKEEENHLAGHEPVGLHSLSKMEGERRVLSVCRRGRARVAVIRAGLLVGRWCYHSEWRLFYRLAKIGVSFRGGPLIHAVAAVDVARAGDFIARKADAPRCMWAYAVGWRGSLSDLHVALPSMLGHKIRVRIPAPSGGMLYRIPLLPPIVREIAKQQGLVFEPALLKNLGFSFTPIEAALKDAANWMKEVWG